MEESLGAGRAFSQRFGVHADLLRPGITRLLPPGWQERLRPLGETGVLCLEPFDLAVAKLHAGRPKDITLRAGLLHSQRLTEHDLRQRLETWRCTNSRKRGA